MRRAGPERGGGGAGDCPSVVGKGRRSQGVCHCCSAHSVVALVLAPVVPRESVLQSPCRMNITSSRAVRATLPD
eukprot:1674521-Alexandrium_andersonii.AAC.1